MLNFTRNQRAGAFDKLPKEIKSAFTSTVLSDIYQKIGKENGLSPEKTNTFAHVVAVIILGLIPRDKFVATLSAELGIDNNQATKLSQIANEKIFLRFKEIAKEQQTREESEQFEEFKEKEVEEKPLVVEKPPVVAPLQQKTIPTQPIQTINRGKTLLDMEKPVNPLTQPAPTVTIPQINTPEINIPKGAPRPWEVAKQQISQNFIGNKLTQNTNVPTERKPMGIQTQTEQKHDPYREKP